MHWIHVQPNPLGSHWSRDYLDLTLTSGMELTKQVQVADSDNDIDDLLWIAIFAASAVAWHVTREDNILESRVLKYVAKELTSGRQGAKICRAAAIQDVGEYPRALYDGF
jgi:hypothetical protein